MTEPVIHPAMPVTVKGQVTIPKPLRDLLGIVPGGRVEFAVEPDGRVTIRKAGTAPGPRRAARPPRPAKGWNGMTTEQIMRLTRDEDWGEPG